MSMCDKAITAPRMIAWYGETSRAERKSNPEWPLQLLEIRERVEQHTNIEFNAVLLNLYRDSSDGIGWHSDKTTSSNKDMNCIGGTHLFRLRHKILKHIEQIEIPLHHATFLLIAGHTNTYWKH